MPERVSDAPSVRDELSPRARKGLRIALYANAAALVVFALQTALGAGDDEVARYWFCALLFLPAAICLARALLSRRERLSWSLLGAGLGCNAFGWLEFVFVTQDLRSPPYPSLADVLWMAFYPACFVALIVLIRARVGSRSNALLLDAALAGLAVASLAAALVFDPLQRATGASDAVVATNLVYPLADLNMFVFLLFLLLLARDRPTRAAVLLAGFGIAAVSDTVFAVKTAEGGYATGRLVDVGWPLMALTLAQVAAWPTTRFRMARLEGWSALWLPGLFAFIAVSLLLYGSVADLKLPAVLLAAITLTAACTRAVVLFNEGMVERERGVAALRRAQADLEARVAARTAQLEALWHERESILNSAGEGIYGVDLKGTTVFANEVAAGLTGYPLDEFVGARSHDLIHHTKPDGSPYPIEECPINDTLTSGTVHEVSRELYFRRDGTTFPAEYTSTPIRESGDIKGAVVVFRDVTERERAERERAALERRLAQSQRLESVGRLAGGIAHDFNNLLAVILNYAIFVREELPEDEPIQSDVAEIERAAERAAALTRQLLVFSRRELVEPQVLDLNSVVTDMEKLLRRAITEDLELRTEFGEGLPAVKADPSQIEQVLLNLTVNARDAMPEGGTLTIKTDTGRGGGALNGGARFVSLTVTDTGCGMSDEVAARAFEPFFSTKARDMGTGLGLATVYGIVAQSGGDIELWSVPGQGTTVEVRLPATDERPAPPTPAPRAPGAPTGERAAATILLVEDDQAVREATRRALTHGGHTVISTGSAADALSLFREIGEAIDLIVTDVVMPEMSGKELVERMRRMHTGLRALYVSGYTDDIVSRHGVLDEGVAFLQKPFDAQELLERVREARSSDLPVETSTRS